MRFCAAAFFQLIIDINQMTARYALYNIADYHSPGKIAVITLDNPPVNSMGMVTREAIGAHLATAIDDSSVVAIVVTGANKVFTGGADIRECELPLGMQSPNLHDLIRAFEASPKPVISAINAVCMGGGTEISLGCHYRVAAPGVMIGLPEVKIGLLPGAGGTQRLPRVAGVELALQMIVSGDAVAAEVLAKTKALDRIIEGDFLTGVLVFAAEIAKRKELPHVRDMTVDSAGSAPLFAAARAKARSMSPQFPAPLKCIDAIEASTVRDIDDGLAYEYKLFNELLATPESAALRHAFFAERAARKAAQVNKI